MARKVLLVAFILALALGVFLHRQQPAARRDKPLEIALWYWHTPFDPPIQDIPILEQAGIKRLYVLAATITASPKPKVLLRQQWPVRTRFEIHLVFRCDRTIVEAMDRDPKALAKHLGDLIDEERARAVQEQIPVKGIQLDLDCPTRLLPKYAHLCKALKGRVGDLEFSVTALPTWYTSDDAQLLADAVDAMIPQLYENDLGRAIQNIRPISTLSTIRQTLDRAANLDRPYWAGLPAYGRALLYDEKGRLAGVQDDISARDALRHPSFKVHAIYPADENGKPATKDTYCGEEIIDLVAIGPAPNGRGKGFHLVYLIPSAELIARQIRELRKAPADCKGIVLFRYPEPGELSTVPLPAIQQALEGRAAKPSISIEVEQKKDPMSAIDGASAETELNVYANNTGPGPTSVHPDAFVLTLELDRPGIEELVPQDVDKVDTGGTSLLRATTLKFARFHLAPGDRIRLATIRLRGPRTITGTWSSRLPGGFENQSGGMPVVKVLRD